MKINTFYSLDNAKRAEGLTVVIDVFRAFTTACYLADKNPQRIIPVGDLEEAYRLKKENPKYLLMGERDGKIQPGFNFGNSLYRIRNEIFKRKTIVFTTTCGTQGINRAVNAKEIITGSFVNADATIKYIRSRKPAMVSLICTGTINEHILDEDACCAEYIKNALLEKQNNFEKIVTHLKTAGFAKWFFDPAVHSHPLEDFELCVSLNKFNFILKVAPYKNNLVYLKKVDV
mgnify:FL=1